MNASDLARLRAVLEVRRDELRAQLQRLKDQLLGTNAADQGTPSFDKNPVRLMSEMARRQLEALDEAIQRMHGGTYCNCTSCGHEISIELLEQVPWTKRCAICLQSPTRSLT